MNRHQLFKSVIMMSSQGECCYHSVGVWLSSCSCILEEWLPDFVIKKIFSYIFGFVCRWNKLLKDSDDRKQRLLKLQDQYRQVEDLYLTFAKKASAFNSWFENAEEDLTDPVRCNSVDEIQVRLIILICTVCTVM